MLNTQVHSVCINTPLRLPEDAVEITIHSRVRRACHLTLADGLLPAAERLGRMGATSGADLGRGIIETTGSLLLSFPVFEHHGSLRHRHPQTPACHCARRIFLGPL
jgi:hypothetical protein